MCYKVVMKKGLIILCFLASVSFISKAAIATTCPAVQDFDPMRPPSGWALLVPPVISGETYYFVEAVHSLNGSFYFKQVICKYASCSSAFCPAFALLSNAQYESPNSKLPPWHATSTIGATLTCRPLTHDPAICLFE